MGQFTARTVIKKSADTVWTKIGRFDDLHWYHGVTSCALKGDERTVINVWRPDLEIDERETAHDDSNRTYSYLLTGFRGETIKIQPDGEAFDFSVLVDHLRCKLQVTPLDAGSCLVTYDLEIDEGYDADLQETGKGYQHCVDHLKQALDG